MEARSRKLGFYKNALSVLLGMRANAPQNGQEDGRGGKEGGHMREGKSPAIDGYDVAAPVPIRSGDVCDRSEGAFMIRPLDGISPTG